MTSTEDRTATDLRERRRSQTRREIAEAAIELFERSGVAATTVEDIAAAAGISPRTFYRLCGTKEQAVLDDTALVAAMGRLASSIDARAPLRTQLIGFWREQMAQIEVDAEGHRRHLRVRRLIADEPTLLAAALRQEHGRDEAFVEALAEATGRGPLQLRALVEWISVLVRLTLEERLCAPEAQPAEALPAIFDRALDALERVETL